MYAIFAAWVISVLVFAVSLTAAIATGGTAWIVTAVVSGNVAVMPFIVGLAIELEERMEMRRR